ncbi:papain fold toxin domain-containing protein [Nostoc sp.]
MTISIEQIQQIKEIIRKYKNLECVECAQAIQDYLISQGIYGKRIKLYTGSAIGRNSYIYDENVSGDAISVNGRHQGIAIILTKSNNF